MITNTRIKNGRVGIGIVSFELEWIISKTPPIAIVKKLKGDEHGLIPALGAALVFMAAHAAIDVDFSFFAFLPAAYGVFALINYCCGDALPVPGKKVKIISSAVMAVYSLVFIVFLLRNMYAQRLIDGNVTLQTVDYASKIDYFEWPGALARSCSFGADEYAEIDELTKGLIDQHAERLAEKPFHYSLQAAEYYFVSGRTNAAFGVLERFLDYRRSDPDAWNRVFSILMKYESGDENYTDGVKKIISKLDAWNEINWGTTELSEESAAFVDRMRSGRGI